MKLKNILLVVSDIERSKAFYKELFGLEVIADFGKNVVLTEGLALQEQTLWETFMGAAVTMGGNDAELYFEEYELDKFLEKMDNSDWQIEYISRDTEPEFGQRVVRLYDPDRHVIEIGEPWK